MTWVRLLLVQTTVSRADAPAALLMGLLFLSFAVFTIAHPERVRTAMDNFANSWKQESWHPYRMPLSALRFVVGTVGISAALFFYIAYVGSLAS
jgi:hypothetical protein